MHFFSSNKIYKYVSPTPLFVIHVYTYFNTCVYLYCIYIAVCILKYACTDAQAHCSGAPIFHREQYAMCAYIMYI